MGSPLFLLALLAGPESWRPPCFAGGEGGENDGQFMGRENRRSQSTTVTLMVHGLARICGP